MPFIIPWAIPETDECAKYEDCQLLYAQIIEWKEALFDGLTDVHKTDE